MIDTTITPEGVPERSPEGGPGDLAPKPHDERRLARVLGPATAVLLVLSCITPGSSVFIIVPELLASQGSGAVLTILAGVLISVAVGACYAELGTRTASSGGEYAMVAQTLGRMAGWLTFALAGVLLFVIPPIIALGTATYIGDLVTVPRGAAAAVVMLLATGCAVLDIKANAIVTGIFLGLEVLAAAAVTVLGLVHAHRGPGELVSAHVATGHGLAPFTVAILFSGLAVGAFVVNGFGTAAYLAEELVEPRRNVPRVVFWSLGLGAVVIVLPTVAAVIGVGNLSDLAGTDFSQLVRGWGGSGIATAVDLGIAIAILNAVIVMVLQNARVLYASARDRAWPAPVNDALTRLHPRWASPVLATALIGVPGAVLAYAVNIESLLGVTSVLVSIIYVVLAIAALRVRRIRTGADNGCWRMPLWPVAPMLVILGVGYALLASAPLDLLITGVVLVIALAYYACYLAGHRDDRFVVVNPSDDLAEADLAEAGFTEADLADGDLTDTEEPVR